MDIRKPRLGGIIFVISCNAGINLGFKIVNTKTSP